MSSLPVAVREKVLAGLTARALNSWTFWARPKQLPPPGDWFVWMLRAGRGFGKTRTGAEWVNERARTDPGEMMLVSKTPADARDDMIEGVSGVVRVGAPESRPVYQPSKRRLVWPSGAVARVRSGADPDGVRGFSGNTVWCDELAAWKYPRETWDNILLGLREAGVDQPRILVTTTPKPLKLLREIEAMPGCVVVRGSTYENASNLSEVFFRHVIDPLAGTSKGRQEIEAELLDEMPGALWTRALLDGCGIEAVPAEGPWAPVRVAVAVDPTVNEKGKGDACGIVVGGVGAGTGRAGASASRGIVFADRTVRGGPGVWAKAVARACEAFGADVVVAEANQGGALVKETLRVYGVRVRVVLVHASRSKQARAEPVVGLYEQGRVRHLRSASARLGDLEDELCNWVPGEASPNRLDALVWLWSYLMLKSGGSARAGVL